MRDTPSTHELADALVETIIARYELTADRLGGLHLPPTYAGHPVDSTAHCVTAWTLSGLAELGVDTIAGHDVRTAALHALEHADPSMEGFGSWWYAEALDRLGGLAVVADPDRAIATIRSPELAATITGPDNYYPSNWTFVVTRGLAGIERLTGERPPEMDDWVARCRGFLASESTGWIDDYPPCAQFDIYTLEMYVMATAFLDEVADEWRTGMERVLDRLDHLAHPVGTVVWGRSTGMLAAAIALETAAYAAEHEVIGAGSPWFERARLAADVLVDDLPDGICGIHQYRTPMFYRGPEHRLNLTFDLGAKFVAAALALRAGPDVATQPDGPVFASTDTYVRYDGTEPAGIWGHRSDALSFVLPAQSGFCIDYAPAPRAPGVFEIPTSGHPAFLPFFHHPDGEQRFPADIPVAADHGPGELTLTHSGWAGPAQPSGAGTPGSRTARYRVEGTTLHIDEEITIGDDAIDHVVILVPETRDRPLAVTATGDRIEQLRIDTAGLAEWRSFWGELPVVHQLIVPLTEGRASFAWSVDTASVG